MGAPHETENPYAKSHPNGRSWLTTARSPRIILLCPVEAYFNPTPPEAAILLGVRFSPFREVTPLFPNQEASMREREL